MSPSQFACPTCGTTLRTPEPMPPGSLVRCPKCQSTFAIPGFLEGSAEPPRGEVVSEADYRRDSETGYGPPRDRPGLHGLPPDYQVDLGEWFQIGGAHYTAVLGPMIGYALLYFLISLVLGVVPFGGCLQFFLDPPLVAGFTLVCLRQLKGEPWTFGDFFGGFSFYGPLLLTVLLTVAIALGCLLPTFAMVIGAAVSADKQPGAAVVFGVLAFCVFLPAYYVIFRISFFSQELILDRGCDALEAVQGSWRLTSGHFWILFAIAFLLGLITLGGLVLCLIGVLFALPYVTLISTAGYLLIAGTRPPLRQPQDRYARTSDDDFNQPV